jgi:hypothetical protein
MAKARISRKPTPVSRTGWFRHYVGRFNKTRDPVAAHLAMWYLLMALAEGDGMYPPTGTTVITPCSPSNH